MEKTCRKRYFELKMKKQKAKDDELYKKMKKLKELERRHCIRSYWKIQLSEKAKKNKLDWAYLDKFKGTLDDIPGEITANNLAHHFQNLTNDYTPIENTGFEKSEIGKYSKFDFKLHGWYGRRTDRHKITSQNMS